MTAMTLDARLGRSVAVDLCYPCQAFWFDAYESLQLLPASVLQLFRAIGVQANAAPARWPDSTACPRCRVLLVLTHDQQRLTKFEYRRCQDGHGRLISFFNFLREKDFIRPLSVAQIEALRQNVHTVNCSNCGAPVDVTQGAACSHCGSPLSMLDLKQAGTLVAQLQQAAGQVHPVDADLPMQLEAARREVETAFASFERQPGWFDRVSDTGLVSAGLGALARWLSERA
jgi:hypothetical protein